MIEVSEEVKKLMQLLKTEASLEYEVDASQADGIVVIKVKGHGITMRGPRQTIHFIASNLDQISEQIPTTYETFDKNIKQLSEVLWRIIAQ